MPVYQNGMNVLGLLIALMELLIRKGVITQEEGQLLIDKNRSKK